MKKVVHSPWFGITLAIVGLIAGYSYVVISNTDVLAAWECPAMENCTGGDCSKSPECASGACTKDCPGNCGSKQS